MKNIKRQTILLGLAFLLIFFSSYFLISARADLENIDIYPYVQNVHEETDGTSSAVIMWKTLTPIDSKVEYRIFGSNNSWQSIENGKPVNWHEIKLSNLEKKTEYTYRVYDGGEATPARSFHTPIDVNQSFRFAVYSDSRDEAVSSNIYKLGPHFILIAGDLTGHGKRDEFIYFLKSAHHYYLKEAPVYPVMGNHDWGKSFFYWKCSSDNFRQVFSLPNNEHYYSLDYGNCHIIGLDNSKSLSPVQTAWLAQDLNAFRSDIRNINKWLIVFMHKPPYSGGKNGCDTHTIRYWVPLFKQYGVDLVLSGHEHCYERTKPIDGIYYIVSGLPGMRPQKSYPIWLEKYIQAKNFCVIDINNDLDANNNMIGSHLILTAYNANTLNPIDTLSLYKKAIKSNHKITYDLHKKKI